MLKIKKDIEMNILMDKLKHVSHGSYDIGMFIPKVYVHWQTPERLYICTLCSKLMFHCVFLVYHCYICQGFAGLLNTLKKTFY